MEMVILIGIQATGKSTFFQKRFADTHVRINLDMLKTRHRERRLIETCLEIQQRLVVDNTNPSRADRAAYINVAKQAGFRVSGFYFQSKTSDAINRNATRDQSRRIPEKGILGTSARLELPSLDEGFDELSHVMMDGRGGFEVKEWQDEVR
jgi:predicted kinase